MGFHYLSIFFYILLRVLDTSSYRVHSALNSIVFTNIPRIYEDAHSEYFFGKCASQNKELLSHEHYDAQEVIGNMLVMGYIRNNTKPNCVYIRASSPYGDMVRYNAYKFTVCIGTITYYYSHEMKNYHFFEWYLPVEMQEGIDWDLFFYVS